MRAIRVDVELCTITAAGRSADGPALPDARAGADPGTLRLSASPHAAAARRLGRGEGALLSRLYRGRPGAPVQAPVAARHGGASGAAAASHRAQRHLEHGRRRRPVVVSAAIDPWAYTNGVVLDFSRRGKPTDNATIESFNGRFREECLNVHWFASLEDAQQKIDAFRWDYNENHPHRAVKGLSSREYAQRAITTGAESLS